MSMQHYQSTERASEEIFKSSGYADNSSASLTSLVNHGIDIAAINPFLRVLLTTDGTITKCLEAYFWENVQVVLIDQIDQVLPFDIACISAYTGDTVITRKVQLVGQQSNKVYATAFSLINPALVPPHVFDQLTQSRMGIGALIRNADLESYREILSVGAINKKAEDFQQEGDDIQCLARTYGINMKGRKAILVNEYFNTSLFPAST